MLTPGTVLQNRYEIMRLIGRGGMGAVYQAKDHRLGHRVALKQMLVEDEQLRQAFEREARILASLDHPVLPGVSDHFAEGDGQFLVMRYIPGDDLTSMLEKQGGALPVKRVLAWADQLLEALEYLHGQQPPIIHRDIKPQNMKVTGRGNIVLLDFGLAKGGNLGQSTRITTTGGRSIFGYTPHYAPLEQIQGTGTDPRSDIYALGATLYHLLTGTQPPDALARATNVLNNRPDTLQPPHFINQQVPLALSTLLMQSMSHNANDRPSSAALMRQMLKNPSAAQTQIVVPYPPSLPNQGIDSTEASTRIHQSAAPASYTAAPYQGATQRVIRPPSSTTRTPQKKNPLVLVLAAIAALLFVFVIGMGGWWLTNNGSQAGEKMPEVALIEETPTPTEIALPTETVVQSSLDVTQESLPAAATQPTESATPTIEEVIPPTETTTPTQEASTPTQEASTPTEPASPEPDQPTHTPTLLLPTNTPFVPTNTPFVPTNTPFVPTNTPFVPTEAPVVSTNIAIVVPTNTPFVPTEAPVVSTNIAIVVPTNTPFLPTNTPFVPTNTPPPPPTITPPPPPTNSPTVFVPTNTPIPPPTITNTPQPVACGVSAGPTFASIWQNNRDLIGCALDNQVAIPTMAEQLFESGHMFWRSDTDEVYVIYDRSSGGTLTQGSWQRDSSWVWDNSDPDGVGKSPPPGYQEPLRGFGWVWRTFLNAENGPLGWAIDREYGFDNIGQAQRFENGIIFKGSDPAIYLLLYNGSFSRQ